jgi:hypothetical protein
LSPLKARDSSSSTKVRLTPSSTLRNDIAG